MSWSAPAPAAARSRPVWPRPAARCSLLEAGGDPRQLKGGARGMGEANRLPDDYDVPAFHPFASENEALRWDFFVRHYADDAAQRRDPKHRDECDGRPVDGVLYPRAGTLGGCTAHNAMILVCPHEVDWNRIAQDTGDPSWSAANMQDYFRAARALSSPAAAAGAGRGRHRPDRPWLGRLATDREVPAAGCLSRPTADGDHRALGRDGVRGQRPAAQAHLLVPAQRRRPQRPRRRRRPMPTACATRR